MFEVRRPEQGPPALGPQVRTSSRTRTIRKAPTEAGAEVSRRLRPARPEPSHGGLRLRPRPARSRQSIRLGVPTNPVIPSPRSFLWMPVSLQGISIWIRHPTTLRPDREPGKKRRASAQCVSCNGCTLPLSAQAPPHTFRTDPGECALGSWPDIIGKLIGEV